MILQRTESDSGNIRLTSQTSPTMQHTKTDHENTKLPSQTLLKITEAHINRP